MIEGRISFNLFIMVYYLQLSRYHFSVVFVGDYDVCPGNKTQASLWFLSSLYTNVLRVLSRDLIFYVFPWWWHFTSWLYCHRYIRQIGKTDAQEQEVIERRLEIKAEMNVIYDSDRQYKASFFFLLHTSWACTVGHRCRVRVFTEWWFSSWGCVLIISYVVFQNNRHKYWDKRGRGKEVVVD